MPEKYDLELLNQVVGKPIPEWEMPGGEDNDEDVEPVACKASGEAEEEEKERKSIRRRRLTKDDVEKFGPTPGCLGCMPARANLPQQSHDETCRTRMEEKRRETKHMLNQ